jgi:hypothetical protein
MQSLFIETVYFGGNPLGYKIIIVTPHITNYLTGKLDILYVFHQFLRAEAVRK